MSNKTSDQDSGKSSHFLTSYQNFEPSHPNQTNCQLDEYYNFDEFIDWEYSSHFSKLNNSSDSDDDTDDESVKISEYYIPNQWEDIDLEEYCKFFRISELPNKRKTFINIHWQKKKLQIDECLEIENTKNFQNLKCKKKNKPKKKYRQVKSTRNSKSKNRKYAAFRSTKHFQRESKKSKHKKYIISRLNKHAKLADLEEALVMKEFINDCIKRDLCLMNEHDDYEDYNDYNDYDEYDDCDSFFKPSSDADNNSDSDYDTDTHVGECYSSSSSEDDSRLTICHIQ